MPDEIVIDLETDPNGLQRVFDGVGQALDNASYRVPLTLVAKEYERFEGTLFEGEKAPDGTPWAPLAASTVKRKGHDVILSDTGKLGTSLLGESGDSIRDVGDRHLTFGTDVEYSGFLQEGTGKMPGREHVGLSEEMVDLTAEYIADGAVVALNRTPGQAQSP